MVEVWQTRNEVQDWTDGFDSLLDILDQLDNVNGLKFYHVGEDNYKVSFAFCDQEFTFVASDDGDGYGWVSGFSVYPVTDTYDAMFCIACELARRLKDGK